MHSLYEQLRQIPFVRLVIALLSGIVWQTSSIGFGFSTLLAAAGFAIIYFILFFIPAFTSYARQWMVGIVGLLCIFFIGTTLTQQQPSQSSLPLGQEGWLQAEICDVPIVSERYTKLQAVVKNYMTENNTVATHEKIILYIAVDSLAEQPTVGATIYAKANLSPIPPPANPDEFDYQKFLAHRQLFASAFVQQGNYLIDNHRGFWTTVKYLPITWQQAGLRILADSPLGTKEYAVMAALSLGNKQFLDDEIRTSYVSAGAMHILAVSGLHVGIIMAILSFVLSFLSKHRRGIVIKNSLIIIFLWLYAALVGFSPSVVRATVMFSFMLVGQTMQRKMSIYNSLAASAFFICVFNPLVIFEAGFQLSYCAVLSIVYFQPHIDKLFYVKNKYLNYIWQLATVSVAAQIGTLPISLLNFHLFPNYFLLTNICIITLTGFIVYGGALYLLVHSVPILSTVVGYALNAMLWLLNHIVQFIESLPYSTTQNIYIASWQMVLLAAIILLIAFYIAFPRRLWLWAAAYCLVAIVGGWSYQSIVREEQNFAVIYKVKNASYIQFVNATNSFALHDEKSSHTNFSFNVSNFQIKHGIASVCKSVETAIVQSDTAINKVCCYRGFVIFEKEMYKILENETIDTRLPAIATDYLIVTGRARMKPENALRRYVPKQIIIDSSVPAYLAKKWVTAAEQQQTPLYNVREQGAWIHSLHK